MHVGGTVEAHRYEGGRPSFDLALKPWVWHAGGVETPAQSTGTQLPKNVTKILACQRFSPGE
jgi:hypothetical protein